jgi:predicted O-methyltransferase YrrM
MEIERVLSGIKTIPSTTQLEEAMLLYAYVKELPLNAIIVELGTGLGRSTAAMAYACIGTNRRIYTIDNYIQGTRFTKEVGKEWSELEAKDNLKRLELDQYVTFIGSATTNPKLLLTIPTPIDFIFIDAGHTYPAVVADVNFWKPVLRKNGIMCGHDWCLDYSDGREVIKAVADTVLTAAYPLTVHHRIWKVRRYW